MHFHLLRVLLSLAFLSSSALAGADGRSTFPTLEDFLGLEEVGLVRPSPDGRLLAVEIRRGRAGEHRTASEDLFPRTDIWIVDTASRDVRRLTDGRTQGTWYWTPVWSPDGRRLALLQGGPEGRVRLALWTRGRDGVRVLTERSVALDANFGSLGRHPPHGQLALSWIDGSRLLTVLQAPDATTHAAALSQMRQTRADQWKRTERGERAVTVWDSRAIPVCGHENMLTMIDVETGAAIPLFAGAVRGVSVSPDGRYAAVVHATASRRPPADAPVDLPLAWNAYAFDARVDYGLIVINLQDGSVAFRMNGIDGLNPLSRRRFPRWSPNSRHFAMPTHTTAGEDRVIEVDLDRDEVDFFDARSPLDAELLAELLSAAQNAEEDATDLERRSRAGEPSSSATIEFAPGHVHGEVIRLAGSRFAVFSRGHLMILDRRGTLLYRLDVPDGTLVHPRSGDHQAASMLLFDTGDAVQRVRPGAARADIDILPKPHPDARLVAAIGGTGSFAFLSERDDGSFLRIMDSDGSTGEPILARNTDLAHLIIPERRLLRYRLSNGDQRTGLAILPPNYEEGRLYPAIVFVYPGVIVGEDHLSQPMLNSFYAYPRALLALAGYVVLFPSIPVPPGDTPFDALSHVTNNVLPAVDALVEQGYADAARIGLLGHSYGGYATLALITQSDRFGAAVASASFSDLIAHHDAVWPANEMRPCGPSIARLAAAEFETRDGILRMRAPPLEALERYIGNSPYFHLKAVRTPLLLLHGELDPVPVDAVERTFVALDRLGIPVRFARYWGEGHNLRSPGNIRHSWSETLAWFDAFLTPAPDP